MTKVSKERFNTFLNAHACAYPDGLRRVGCHGLHVTVGLVWLAVMVAQVAVKSFRPSLMRRRQCFSFFWHALVIVWVALFSVLYLMGAPFGRPIHRSSAWPASRSASPCSRFRRWAPTCPALQAAE